MIVCYLDDSDAEQSSVITLAGYARAISDWERYEVHADAVCKDYGVGILHATDFHGTRGCFAGWSYKKKRNFIDALYENSDDLFGISHSVNKLRYKEGQSKAKTFKSTSAYGLAFNTMVGGFMISDRTSSLVEEQGLSFVVEAGHRNNAELEQIFHTIRKNRPSLKSLTFSGKAESRAIQLADLFAYYSRRQAAKMDALKAPPTVAQSEKLEEKMFSLISTQCQHVVAILPDPFGEEMVPIDEATFAHRPPPGRHLFSAKGRQEDPPSAA